MALDLVLLQRKLEAIRANYADADSIVAHGTVMPFVGLRNKNQWLAWLQKRIDVLQNALDGKWTDAQIHTFYLNLYNSLSSADQVIADDIWNHRTFWIGDASGTDAHDKLCAIILYRFIAPTAT